MAKRARSSSTPRTPARSTGHPRPRRAQAGPASPDDTRQRILTEARQLFRDRGYDGTSLAELAKRVGITAAGLYWHFSNKEEILGETLEAEILDLIYSTGAAEGGRDPEQRLRSFVRAHVTFQLDRLEVARLFEAASYGFFQLVRSLSDEQRERIERLERQHIANLRRILEEGVESGVFDVADYSATTFAIIGMGEHAVYWWKPTGRMTADEVAALYADFAVKLARP